MVAPDAARPVRALLHEGRAAKGTPVTLVSTGAATMAKASADGVYTTTDEHGRVHRFKARKGDALPEGATVEAAAAAPSEGAPKKPKKQAKTGPSETTESASEPETT